MHIVGITGTSWAGKGTVVEILISQYGYQHYGVSEYLSQELKKQGLAVDRQHLIDLANQLRSKHGNWAIVQLLYQQAKKQGGNAIIESLRSVWEVQELQKNADFILLAVDADPQTRYQRILQRKSAKDQISRETFLQQEHSEMQNTDPNKQNIQACMDLANYHINNDGTLEELKAQIQTLFDH